MIKIDGKEIKKAKANNNSISKIRLNNNTLYEYLKGFKVLELPEEISSITSYFTFAVAASNYLIIAKKAVDYNLLLFKIEGENIVLKETFDLSANGILTSKSFYRLYGNENQNVFVLSENSLLYFFYVDTETDTIKYLESTSTLSSSYTEILPRFSKDGSVLMVPYLYKYSSTNYINFKIYKIEKNTITLLYTSTYKGHILYNDLQSYTLSDTGKYFFASHTNGQVWSLYKIDKENNTVENMGISWKSSRIMYSSISEENECLILVPYFNSSYSSVSQSFYIYSLKDVSQYTMTTISTKSKGASKISNIYNNEFVVVCGDVLRYKINEDLSTTLIYNKTIASVTEYSFISDDLKYMSKLSVTDDAYPKYYQSYYSLIYDESAQTYKPFEQFPRSENLNAAYYIDDDVALLEYSTYMYSKCINTRTKEDIFYETSFNFQGRKMIKYNTNNLYITSYTSTFQPYGEGYTRIAGFKIVKVIE